MKQNARVALSGMVTALTVLFMLLSYFPYLTYAIPAIAGLLTVMLVIEINVKWATVSYFAAAVLVFLFAEPEAKLMYICLFGYYPVLKAVIERINKPVIEWILKLAVFNAAVLLVYGALSGVFGISAEDMGDFGKYGVYALLAAGNVAFVFYDIAVSRMSVFYMHRLHTRVARLFSKSR